MVLGDLAGRSVHQPIIVPWSDGLPVAPTMLRNTVAGALASQAAPRSAATSVAGQLAHLAFPFTLSEQGPFGARGIPAVTLSLSGDAAPAAGEPTSADQMTAMGRSVLLTINALDNGPQVARADAFVLFQGKVIPAWAIRLLVLALILPVLIATIDGLARARRRGHSISRAVVWVLASAVPFAFAALLIVAARVTGVIDTAPPAPVAGGAVPLHSTGIALLIALAIVVGLAFFALRPLVIWLGGAKRVARVRDDASDCLGAAAALLLVMCLAALAIWVTNPFAAALVIPALHLWMWLVDPEVRLHPAGALALLLGGLVAPVGLIVFYAHAAVARPARPALERRSADRRRPPHDRRRDRVQRAPGVSRQRRAHRPARTQRAASRGRSGHGARPDHIRWSGLARWNGVGPTTMRRLIRDISSVLIISGLLLVARRRA